MLRLSSKHTITREWINAPNLCERFSKEDRQLIANQAWDGYQADRLSRQPWERRTSAAMDLAMQIAKDKNFPWQGASNVIFPLVTIAALQFSARSYPAIIQGTDVVKYRTLGADPRGEVMMRAQRVARHMSWQVLEEDEAWEEQHDRLLINLAVVGSAYIKSYFDGSKGHNVSELVMARDLVSDYWAKSINTCARKTHIIPMYRNDIWERIMDGIFCDIRNDTWFQQAPASMQQAVTQYDSDNRRGVTVSGPTDHNAAYTFLEQHTYLDCDGDGYAEPYTFTFEESSKTLCRVVARFEEPDIDWTRSNEIRRIKSTEAFTPYVFIPSPDGGNCGLGFGAFLGPINEAVNSSINQLLDSGTFQNSIGGFLGRGAKIRGGVYSMAPWEWKRVDSSGDDLRKNLIPFPDRQPLTVTFQLIELLIQYADRLAGTTENLVGESTGQNTPAETSRNMTEQGMKVYSMIFKRVWRSMKEEFKKLYKLNKVYLLSQQTFGTNNDFIRREDYSGNADQIAPVADPNITSTTMQIYQAEAVRQAAFTTPGYDRDEASRRWLKSLKVDNIETLFLGEKQAEPLPNPKMAVEQAKLQGMQMKIEAEKIHWANELLIEQKESQARIDLMKAQVVKLIADIGAERAALQIDAFETMIKHFEAYHGAITDRIGALTGGMKGGSSDGSGVQGVARAPSDQSPKAISQIMDPGSQGSMGGGQLPSADAA